MVSGKIIVYSVYLFGLWQVESVKLALQILDGSDLRGHTVHVERAKFTMKGNFDPKKRRKKLSAKEKKKLLQQQQK